MAKEHAPLDPSNRQYWQDRYAESETGWDIGYVSPPLKAYFDQLTDRSLRILIPGAGNAYEAEYLWREGFSDVTVLDIAAAPLEDFARRLPDYPREHLVQADFFDHQGTYDLIIEQTFFCSFYPTPENRQRYARKAAELLVEGGRLVGLFFNFPIDLERGRPPYGGSRSEYLGYFEPFFQVKNFEAARNSLPERAGNELFANLRVRDRE